MATSYYFGTIAGLRADTSSSPAGQIVAVGYYAAPTGLPAEALAKVNARRALRGEPTL